MDHFMEEVVVKHNRTFDDILYVLSWIMLVIFGLFGLLMLQSLLYQFSVPALIETVIFIGGAVLLFLFKDRLKTEYEYTFTNGDLDFAQVFNNQKRKALGTMRVKNVEAFGPVDSNEFRKLINMPGINRKNWFLNRGAKLYYFYYQKENNRTIIVLEPSEELPEAGAWTVSPEEIDDNGHLNNVVYVRHAQRFAPRETKFFEVIYDHECFLGETIRLFAENGCVRGMKADGSESFRARFKNSQEDIL